MMFRSTLEKETTVNLRMKRKKTESLKSEITAESIPLNSRLARGKITVNKMIIYDPLPEDNKNVRTFRVGRVLEVHRHSSTISSTPLRYYNKNKIKMAGVVLGLLSVMTIQKHQWKQVIARKLREL